MTPSAWRVFLRQEDPAGCSYLFAFEGCPGHTDEEAIDYALEQMGPLPTGWTVTRAYAALESGIGPEHLVGPVRRAAFKRRDS